MTFSPKNSNLKAEFPQKSGTPVIRYLIFLGNATVKEDRKATYVQYNPIGRNSSLFSYTGGESRVFTVEYQTGFNLVSSILKTGAANISDLTNYPRDIGDSNDRQALFFQSTSNPDPFRKSGAGGFTSSNDLNQDNIVRFMDYQIGLIRSMLLNNAEDPTVGPPLIRLNYGMLYEDIPCIMESYSINNPFSTDPKDVHDVDFIGNLLIPRNKNYTINMVLKEVRTGDFLKTKFAPSVVTRRDNNVGFEQIISNPIHSINPGRIK